MNNESAQVAQALLDQQVSSFPDINSRLLLWFICLFVVVFIAWMSESSSDSAAEQAKELTNKVFVVFCGKGDGAFQYGDSLIDDLAQNIEKLDCLKVPDNVWSDLEKEIVSILQNKPIDEKLYKELSDQAGLSEFESNEDKLIDGSIWFSIPVEGEENRVQIARIFDDCKQVLLCNYAGMKFGVLTFAELESGCRKGDYRVLSPYVFFSQVIEKSLTGLLKVALTQRQARVDAAEKAKKEAEDLLAEKEKSDKPEKLNHYGLAIIEERNRHLNGHLRIETYKNKGTKVFLSFLPEYLNDIMESA